MIVQEPQVILVDGSYLARIYESGESGGETLHNTPNVRVNIYTRKDHTYMLRCYSYFGDSILLRFDPHAHEWVDMGNIEHRTSNIATKCSQIKASHDHENTANPRSVRHVRVSDRQGIRRNCTITMHRGHAVLELRNNGQSNLRTLGGIA